MGGVELVEADRVRELLDPETMWHTVDVVARTGSTNADLARLARQSAGEGQVLIAREQVAGRGRRARTWASPPDTSISVSVLLEPRAPLEKWGWLSLLTGLAVTEALEELAEEPKVQLKWPNDVLVNDKKVCGILSEAIPDPGGDKAVVGFGLNIALTAEQLPVPTATSLLLEGMTQDQNVVAAAVLRSFEHHYRNWQAHGSLRDAYQQRCASVGRELRIDVNEDRSVTGGGYGVDEDGRLLVTTDKGIESFAVGDVVHAKLGG